jgi:nitrate/TMAO reductase-like tetraheme cytochrome c subunit
VAAGGSFYGHESRSNNFNEGPVSSSAACGFRWERGALTALRQSTNNENARAKVMKMKLLGFALGTALAFMAGTAGATLIGSGHDFSSSGGAGNYSALGIATFTWGGETNTYQNPCQVCHIPHKAAAYSASHAPLWNHNIATNATTRYTTYDQAGSASFNALGLGALTLGSSVACLSCHDGSIAVNQSYGKSSFNGNGGVGTNAPNFAIETFGGSTDLTHMHPIGVSYSSAKLADPDLNATPAVGSGTVLARMLKGPNQTVECASCHDIHRTIGASATVSHELIVDLNGGQLCLTCHNK